MPLIELVFEDPYALRGAVVGSVEIVDQTLETRARTVITAGEPVRIDLPDGRYFAYGWLPSGTRIEARFELGQGGPTEATVTPRRQARDDQPFAHPVEGWLRTWHFSSGNWAAGPAATTTTDAPWRPGVVVPGQAGTTTSALQVGGAEELPPYVIVVPTDTPLVLTADADQEPGVCTATLAPGADRTLLDYLHRGDLPSARVVVDHVLARHSGPGDSGSPLLDLAIGYFLLRGGDEAADDWISRLTWTQPDSVDAVILDACRRMRAPAESTALISDDLVRAAAIGLPVVSAGLRMLANGLSAADGRAASEHLARLRGYLLRLEPHTLTTFAASHPGHPGSDVTVLSPVARFTFGLSPVEASNGLPAKPYAASDGDIGPPADRGTVAHLLGLLVSAFQLACERGLGWQEIRREFQVEDLTLAVAATPGTRTGTFDVELRADTERHGSRLFAGQTLMLRVSERLYYLSVVDAAGRAVFGAVPAGDWDLAFRGRSSARRLPGETTALPPVRAEVALVASTAQTPADVVRVLMPGGQELFVLGRLGSGEYVLEVVRSHVGPGTLTVVEYTRDSGATDVVLVPLPAVSGGRASSVIRLDGFDPREPWHASTPGPVSGLTDWPLAEVMRSVGAAASAGTRQTWRAVADQVAGEYGPAIHAYYRELPE